MCVSFANFENLKLAMSHIWMSHVTHTNESCHTYGWVMCVSFANFENFHKRQLHLLFELCNQHIDLKAVGESTVGNFGFATLFSSLFPIAIFFFWTRQPYDHVYNDHVYKSCLQVVWLPRWLWRISTLCQLCVSVPDWENFSNRRLHSCFIRWIE